MMHTIHFGKVHWGIKVRYTDSIVGTPSHYGLLHMKNFSCTTSNVDDAMVVLTFSLYIKYDRESFLIN